MNILQLPKEKRRIFITGCSTGIGWDCVERLKDKYTIIASARKSKDVDHLKSLGVDALLLDVDDSNSIDQAVTYLSQTGGIYALFNNAGYGQPGAVEDLTRDIIRQQFETNVFGALELTNKLIPLMRAQGYGRLIFNSSLLGFVSMPFRGAYNASKHAMEGLVDTLRLELTSSNIQVSLIEPGPIKSQFRANAFLKFKENIDQEKSVHHALYKKVTARLENQTNEPPFTLDAVAITHIVDKILCAKSPNPKYYSTVPTHLFGILKRLLSVSLMDKVLLLASGKENA